MKCDDFQANFGIYWELSEDDAEREAIEAHLLDCQECNEHFRLWEESEEMLRLISDDEESVLGPIEHVNRNVMDRIYAEQSWLIPAANKSYHFSKSFRRNIALVIAGCMAMFACALIFFIIGTGSGTSQEQMAQLTGLMDTANASGHGLVVSAEFEVPVASVSEPFVLKVVPTYPQYWAALSLLGIIMTLLILNWLSRTRS